MAPRPPDFRPYDYPCPVPFHDLPITISHILIAIQNDFDMEAADLAEGAKGTLTL